MQGRRWHSDTEGIGIRADLFNNEDEAEAPPRYLRSGALHQPEVKRSERKLEKGNRGVGLGQRVIKRLAETEP
jgi:hypothetical protein